VKDKTYPYTETSLEDLKGEEWEDIPFLDGLYLISNLGRVKRLAREVYTSDGKIMRLKEKIIHSYPDVQINKSVSDKVYHLAAHVTVENISYKFSIPRLVYYCFVKKFPLDNYSLVVYAKDGDGKNIRPSNLRLTDLFGKAKRVFERGRLKRDIETTHEEYLRTKSVQSSNPYCKQVSQYSGEGKFIRTFPSIRVASRVTGVSENGILSVLKGRQIRSGGFAWDYGARRKVDVQAIRKANIDRLKKLVGRKVNQYKLNGNRIAIYYTIAEASRKTKANESDIHAVLTGSQRSAGGYIWKKGFGKPTINVKGYLTGVAWRAQKQQKKVTKYDFKRNPVKIYESIKQAAEKEGISDGYISMAVKKKLVIRGFLWRFS
jgi:hypothetical protein